MNETTPENDIAYPEDQSCCFVNGLSYSSDRFSVRAMNFGQPWRSAGITEVAYQAYLPCRFVSDILRQELAAYQADAIAYIDGEDQFEKP